MGPRFTCSVCGYEQDTADDAYGNATPSKGDVSLCMKCGAIYLFEDNLTVHKASREEIRDLMGDPAGWARIERAQRACKKVWEKKRA